jgi:hypothetical protein
MHQASTTSERLAVLFALGNLLFNYPLLTIFNHAETIWGVPLLYAYVFGAWGTLIVLMALAVEKR